ncbi:class I SAM-dependent methyltransferase [Desulfobacter latus]|uniref:Methyltransferase domain-containing protein n=1 Tax=Desulfobacter latus TaxID=2292 RepID=A0A850T873_9BACT|nr:class I SAM-dependent methyltransferase [Desulfobacter latus]NWH05662.1 methyltransferase domain-containing protein [Desulfobacter latus]
MTINNLKYSSLIDINDDKSAHAVILREIKHGSTVLEFGPGPGCMTRYLKEELGCHVSIVEMDETFFPIAEQYSDDALSTDIEDLKWIDYFSEKNFDYVIFADVLEHLKDPWGIIDPSVRLLKDGGSLIVSLPNAAHSAVVLGLIQDQFVLNDTGLLDRTHLRFFTFESAKDLCTHSDLFLCEARATYRAIEQTEVYKNYKNYKNLPEDLVDEVLNKAYGDVFQFIFHMKKKSAEDDTYSEPVIRIAKHNSFEQQMNFIDPMVYWTRPGEKYVPENCIKPLYEIKGHEVDIRVSLARLEGPIMIRLRPCEVTSVIEIRGILSRGNEMQKALPIHQHSGQYFSDNIIIFDDKDPSIIVELDAAEIFSELNFKTRFLSINGIASNEMGLLGGHIKRGAKSGRDNINRLLYELKQFKSSQKVLENELQKKVEEEIRLKNQMSEQREKITHLYNLNRNVLSENNRLQEILSYRIVHYACRLQQVKNKSKWIVVAPFAVVFSPLLLLRVLFRTKRRVSLVLARCKEYLKLLKNKKRLRLELKYPNITKPVGFDQYRVLAYKLRTIPIENLVSENGQMRFNILVPSLDPDIVFGGYISLLHLVRRIFENGYPIRFVVCDDSRMTKRKLIDSWQHKPELVKIFSASEFENIDHHNETFPISAFDNDRFIAYSGWEGLIANQMVQQTTFKKFIFFIQEYEPIFHEENSIRAVLESAYTLPHIPVFNTEILRHHFVKEALGVYSKDYDNSGADSPCTSLVFEHAIADIAPPDQQVLVNRLVRKFLFYARPEGHAGRNLYALGMLALTQAIRDGFFKGAWEFWGIGTFAENYEVKLDKGHKMKIIHRVPQEEYEEFIKGFDVGVSLMMAPHPSILPFEMASAGMVVVTNEYRHRDADVIKRISKNILPCKLSVESIAHTMGQAAEKSKDIEARIEGFGVNWNRNWDEAFSPEFIASLVNEVAPKAEK